MRQDSPPGEPETRGMREEGGKNSLPWEGLAPTLVGLVLIVLLILTWGRAVEPIVDFGRELYVAWRISEGDALYRDLAYFSGPLSPYVNALWFRLWGPGIRVLVTLNVIILVLFTAISYRLLYRLTGPIPAMISCSAFLGLCAFPQYTTYGSFNFLAPYSHELTHGLLIASLGLLFLRRTGDGSLFSTFGVGICIGLGILTKPEMALATTIALALGVGLAVSGAGWTGRKRVKSLALLLVGVIIPTAGFAALWSDLGASWIREALWGPWSAVANPEVRGLSFYQISRGFDSPGMQIRTLLTWSGIWGGAIGVPLVILRLVPTKLRDRPTLGAWVFALSLAPAITMALLANGFQAFSPLPIVLLVVGGSLLLEWPRQIRLTHKGDWVLGVAGCLFSLLLLAKLGLRPQLGWYGFALAAPALLVVIAWAFGPLPRRLGRHHQGSSRVIIGSTAAWLIVIATFHGIVSWAQYRQRTYAVKAGNTRILVDPPRGQAIQPALLALGETLQPGQSLLVLPEGAAINFLLRVPSPTPYFNFMPPELILFGEDQILEALEKSPPDFVLLVPKPTSEFAGQFGVDYGVNIQQWVQTRYEKAQVFPGGSLAGEPFDVELLIRGRWPEDLPPPEALPESPRIPGPR